jgi:hypothetical protein
MLEEAKRRKKEFAQGQITFCAKSPEITFFPKFDGT